MNQHVSCEPLRKIDMTMSKFCRLGGVHPTAISKRTTVPMWELNILFKTDIHRFNKFVESVMSRRYIGQFLTFEEVRVFFNINQTKLYTWLIRGVETKTVIKTKYISYGSVCELIAAGRA